MEVWLRGARRSRRVETVERMTFMVGWWWVCRREKMWGGRWFVSQRRVACTPRGVGSLCPNVRILVDENQHGIHREKLCGCLAKLVRFVVAVD